LRRFPASFNKAPHLKPRLVSRALRTQLFQRNLFLDRCNWEWLFGFENRDKVFEIDSRFKFNPIIIQKGGKTESILTVFMRRRLEDWERAESFVTHYTRAQVERLRPLSNAIIEIQSSRDLEILEKIYLNSVLLGDDGPDGWGIKYAREFDMTNGSNLFPLRPKWEEQGYRLDEYSRWLKGNWRPIAELRRARTITTCSSSIKVIRCSGPKSTQPWCPTRSGNGLKTFSRAIRMPSTQLSSKRQREQFVQSHPERCGRPVTPIGFYADVVADVLSLPACPDQTTAYSVLEALRFAATRVLDMHMEDLQILVIGHIDRDEVDGLLWEPMLGGSGLLDQNCERFGEVATIAREVVEN